MTLVYVALGGALGAAARYGEWGRAGWYMMGSMLLGVAAVILGFSAGSALLSARARP